METTQSKLISLGKYILVAAMFLLMFLSFRECKRDKGLLPAQKEYIENLITDTLYKGKYNRLKKLYDKKVIPKTITYWDTVYVPTIEYINYKPGDKDVVIKDKDKPEIVYDTRFLTLYPNNPKLIQFKLIKDYLDIDLLNTDGNITSTRYPIFLDNVEYQWIDNQLNQSPFKSTKNKLSNNIRFKGLYTNVGYDLYSKLPTTGLEYNIELYRFKLDGEINTTFNNTNPLSAQVKIGYRIIK